MSDNSITIWKLGPSTNLVVGATQRQQKDWLKFTYITREVICHIKYIQPNGFKWSNWFIFKFKTWEHYCMYVCVCVCITRFLWGWHDDFTINLFFSSLESLEGLIFKNIFMVIWVYKWFILPKYNFSMLLTKYLTNNWILNYIPHYD